jgi:hypothetical protein
VRRWTTALTRAMVSIRARRIGRREAEELLSGSAGHADRDALVHLLDLAAAPPQADELAGRRAAVADFVRAREEWMGTASRRGRQPLAPMITKALAVKLTAGFAVVFLGGAALAATTGSLPASLQHGAHTLFAPLGVPVPDATPGQSAHPTPDGGHPSTAPGTRPGDPVLSADPAMQSLCRSWEAGGKNGKGVDAGVLRKLSAAAGGTDRIPAFCTAVLAATPSTAPAPEPSSTAGGPPLPTPSHPAPDKSHGKPTRTPHRS